MNPFDRKAERSAGEAGWPALPHIPMPSLPDLLKVRDDPGAPVFPPRLIPELRPAQFPNPGFRFGGPALGPQPATGPQLVIGPQPAAPGPQLAPGPQPALGPDSRPSSAPPTTQAHPSIPNAATLVAAGLSGVLIPTEEDGRMSLAVQWLGNKNKDMMDEAMTAKANERPLPDDLICVDGISYEGPDGTPLMADVYRPKDTSADPLPIVVFVHGGALFVGNRKTNREYVELLAERGYVVFVPEYRVLEETDGIGAIADVCAGLSYLASHADEFGGDLTRVLVNAESAGSFPALYATAVLGSSYLQEEFDIQAPELYVRGLACFGGMLYTTSDDPVGLVYHRAVYGDRLRDKDFMELMNPEDRRIEWSLPSVLQVTSGADFLKAHTLRYDEVLERAGHDHRLIYFEEGPELTHAFPSLRPELPQSKEVLDELDAWFRGL